MATTTTNYSLTKPAYSDTADIAVVNGNMDKVDTALNGLGAGLAVISNNNTHGAISKGQYVYIRGHGTLGEGLYKAKSAIAANATLSGTNVESAVLGTAIAALADKAEYKPGDTFSTNGAQYPCRTLNDLSAVYFSIRALKDIGSAVTGFSVSVLGNSNIWGVSGAGTIQTGALASNKTINGNAIRFSLPTSGTITGTSNGVCELNVTITFT